MPTRAQYLITLLAVLTTVASTQSEPRLQWMRTLGGPGSDTFWDIYATSDGGCVSTGEFESINDQPGRLVRPLAWVVKMSADGETEWDRRYHLFGDNLSSSGASIIEADDGGFVIGGWVGEDAYGTDDQFLGMKVDADGELLWAHRYREEFEGYCGAVIELKSGEYLFGGSVYNEDNRSFDCYLVLTDVDGDVIWERTFGSEGRDGISGIREAAEDGFYLSGKLNRVSAVFHTDSNGELEWQRTYPLQNETISYLLSIVSHQNGYLVGGYYYYYDLENRFRSDGRVLFINRDGGIIFDRNYNPGQVGEDVYTVASLGEGGFYCAGAEDGHERAILSRMSPGGEILWSMGNFVGVFRSMVTDRIGGALVCGSRGYLYENGVVLKYAPERSAPFIVAYSPEELEFDVLQGDSVEFWVSARDFQDDPITYRWTLDGDSVGADSSFGHRFNELGAFNLRCIVSDTTGADSIGWLVNVKELAIDSFFPDTLHLRLRREHAVDFSVQARAVEGGQIHYLWELDGDEVGDDRPEYSHHFNEVQVEPYMLTATAYRGEASDTVMWEVYVRSAVWAWWPREFEVSVAEGDSLEFGVEPFDPESPNLAYRWYLDGEAWPDSAAGAGAEVAIGWDDAGEHSVSVMVRDGVEADSLAWQVRVYDPAGVEPPDRRKGGGSDGWAGSPAKLDLSIAPNPFNDAAEVRFALPRAGEVRLGLYDINGRLVADLIEGRFEVGIHSITLAPSALNARPIPTGVYFVHLQSGGANRTQKLVMMR